MIEKQILNVLPIMILVVDEDGIVEFANPSFLNVVRNDLENVVGKRGGDVMNCIHTEDHPDGCGSGEFCQSHCGFRVCLRKIIESKDIEDDSFEFRVKGVDEPLYFNVRAIPFADNKQLYTFFIDDRTKETTLQKALELSITDLKTSNRELENFAYIASHDLKEPLRIVAGYINLLKEEYPEAFEGEAKTYMDYILKASNRMQSQVEALLTLARITSNKKMKKSVPMGEVILESINNLRLTIEEKKAKVTYDKLPNMMCDRDHCTLLFQNLIGNSLKYSKPDVPPVVHISATTDKSELVYKIEDNGIGIDEKYKDEIFDLFNSKAPDGEARSSGIGLTIVKKIVEKHGGKIYCESKVGKGTTFFIKIPKK